MASLTGTKIKDTYDALLKVSDNGALDGTLQTITDGLGNNSALSLSTAGASVGGTLSVSGESTLNGAAFSDGSDLKFDLSTTSDAKIGRLDRAFIQIDRNDFAGLISFHTTPSGSSGLAERMKIYSGGDISFRDSSANEAFYWDASAASLGIGGAPTYALDVTKTGQSQIARFNFGDANGGVIQFATNGVAKGYIGTAYHSVSPAGSANDIGIRSLANLVFVTGGGATERMRIDSSGSVAIGPDAGTRLVVTPTENSDVTLNVVDGASTSRNMILSTGNTERMRITSGGYLKASNTGSYLNASGNYHELVTSTDSQPVNVVIHKGTSGPSGTSTQFTAASPNNTVYYFQEYVDSTTTRCKIWSNGNIQNFNNSYGALSDVKLKENIIDASPKLVDLMQVKIRNYNLIGDDKKQIGVVAQELEEVFPAMIDESPDFEEREVELKDEDGNIVYKTEQVLVSEAVLDEEGNVIEEAVYETIVTDEPEMTKERVDLGTVTKSVKYSVFVPMLIKAIQELNAKVESLEAQLNA